MRRQSRYNRRHDGFSRQRGDSPHNFDDQRFLPPFRGLTFGAADREPVAGNSRNIAQRVQVHHAYAREVMDDIESQKAESLN